MKDLSQIKIQSALVKIIGIFEAKDSIKKLEKRFSASGYSKVTLDNPDIEFHRNYWYPEFRNIWFSNSDEGLRFLTKEYNQKISFKLRDKPAEVLLKSFEVYLMPNGLHFFSFTADCDDKTATGYSNLMFLIRNFYSQIFGKENYNWVNWIEENCLCGIKISIDEKHPNVKTDDYSGSKFKLYSVFEMEKQLEESDRFQLLYELGSVSKISNTEVYDPLGNSKRYIGKLLLNRITVFNNYDMLPLLDSFTVLGIKVLNDNDSNTLKNYNETYFRIYLHALLLKYNLFRYQSEFHMDNLNLRDTFEKFLNSYHLSHISYNFLPNLIYKNTKVALELDEELEKFKDRIVGLNESIKEEQQKRTNVLLGILGILTSVSSFGPVLNFLEDTRNSLHSGLFFFYTAIGLILILFGYFLLWFLFPSQLRWFWRRYGRK
jgi:hypothetical protein